MADSRIVALQALIRKEEARKKKREAGVDPSQNPAGSATHDNDGRASQRIVMATVDEILGNQREHVKRRVISATDMAVINASPDFLGRKKHPHQDTIPMLSLWRNERKSHSTLKKKQIVEFCKRMSGNAPNYVRMRLGCEEIDDNFARMIADAVRKNTYGRELLLYGNRVTDEGVRLLVDALRFHPLERLSLGGNLLSDDAARQLADLCHQNQRIRYLNVANRWPQKRWSDRPEDQLHPFITSSGAWYFADRLLHNGCGLVALYLSDQVHPCVRSLIRDVRLLVFCFPLPVTDAILSQWLSPAHRRRRRCRDFSGLAAQQQTADALLGPKRPHGCVLRGPTGVAAQLGYRRGGPRWRRCRRQAAASWQLTGQCQCHCRRSGCRCRRGKR